jgi:eukaryotic-like serine/threonine-protein kinase
MADDDVCPDCGAKLPANRPGGLCPQCLLRLGLGADLLTTLKGDDEPGLALARTLGRNPRLVQALSGGPGEPGGAGVLTTLEETIGPVPRVLLRDAAADDPRPVRPRSEEMPNLTGEPVRYHLLGEIARGGMGAILKGRDTDLGRDLAVKVLLEKHRDRPEMVRRFVEEAQIGGQLQHPGIVPVYEIGQFTDGRLYIAMKLVKGRNLAALLEARRDPEENRPRFLSIFEQVCQTMAYAHVRGVVHRDLKPSNVMVGDFGEVQVMDWGLAKVLDQGGVADEERARRSRNDSSAIRTVRTGSDAAESEVGSILGTPAYMAPEQARGELDTVDERADVFGLGSILCEILTGHPAYEGRTSVELYSKAERADLTGILARLDACSADGELVALARSCLAAAPRDRPRDATGVLAGLTSHLAGAEMRLRAAELAQAKAETRTVEERRRRLLTLALASSILATALLGGGAWAWIAGERAQRTAKTASDVSKALYDSAVLRSQARSATHADSTKWLEAIAAIKQAQALLDRTEGLTDLRNRVQAQLTAIVSERNAVEAAGKDHRMIERLAQIHDDFAVHFDSQRMDAEYTAAFRDYGVDVDALDPAVAGVLLAQRPVAVDLAGALDQWTFNRRRMRPPAGAGARHLVEVAKVADPDPWRNRLRDALDPAITEQRSALGALERLAATADPDSLPGESVSRLAFALSSLRSNSTAVSLLRHAQRAHPRDFWINMDLAGDLRRAGQLDDALRFYSVAVSIRPKSGLALRELGKTLRDSGRLEEADTVLREADRLWPPPRPPDHPRPPRGRFDRPV